MYHKKLSAVRRSASAVVEAVEQRLAFNIAGATFAQVDPGFAVGPMRADSKRDLVYVLDTTNNKVLAVDTDLGKTVASADVGGLPTALAESPDGSQLFVSSSQGNVIDVFALPDLSAVRAIPFTQPQRLAVGTGGQLFVGGAAEFSPVTKIDAVTGAVEAKFGSYYSALPRVNGDGTKLYLSEVGLSTTGTDGFDISNPAVAPVSIGSFNTNMANGRNLEVDDTYHRLYAMSGGVYGIYVVDTDTKVGSKWWFSDAAYGTSVSVSPNSPYVYAGSQDFYNGGVFEYDRATGTQVSKFTPAGTYKSVWDVQETPNGKVLYGADPASDLSVVQLGLIGNGSLVVGGVPVARATATGGGAALTEAFNASASTPYLRTQTLTAYQWNFGDGTTGQGVQSAHTYAKAGTYTVKLTVTSSTGLTDDYTLPVTVTGPTSTTTLLEAEDAVLSAGTAKQTNHSGYTGTGFADFGGDGSAAQFSFNSPAAGAANLQFRYANGGTTNRPMTIYVNGVSVGTLPFAPTGGWDTWQSTGINVNFVAGVNTIKAVAGPATGGNLDSLTISAPTSQPANAAITGYAFTDVDGDGLYDNSDTRLVGATIFLDANNNGVLDAGETSVKSSTNGMYAFTLLPAGLYHVREVPPSGYAVSTPAIDIALSPAQQVTGQVIGVKPTGGTTQPTTTILQAESATLSGGTVQATNHSGYTGSGFADYGNSGSAVQFSYSASAAGAATLTFRYANGGTSARPLSVIVNGVTIGTVACNPTGGWDTWGTVSISANLIAGANTIKAVAGAATGGNLDSLTITTTGGGTTSPLMGSISGIVFADANGNGVRDAGETTLFSSSVFLDTNNNGVWDASETKVQTTTGGVYTFANLAAGTYHVREIPDTGDKVTTAPIDVTLAAGQALTVAPIGEGPATTTPTTITLQAEDATLTGGTAKQTNHTGYTGTGFADFGGSGSATQFSVSQKSAGAATLTFRYANGATAARPLTVVVNGVTIGTIACNFTGGWDTWNTVTITANLIAGTNTIKAVAGAATGSNLDSLAITGTGN